MKDARVNLHLDQFSGVWAIKPANFRELAGAFNGFDLAAHLKAQHEFIVKAESDDEPSRESAYEIKGGVALIGITGVMTKYGSSLTGGGTMQTRRMLRNAMANPDVSGVLLTIDSPGGTVQGTGDLADDFAALSRVKPTTAYVEDLCASAAYWVASQAGRVSASANSDIGSIGTFAVIEDWSKAVEKAGGKVHVIKAGEGKGAGVPGTEITAEQLAAWQTEIDATNELFVSAVSRGRKADATAWADGRVRRADRALKAGMIDSIGSIDAAMTELKQRIEDNMKSILAADDVTKPEDEEKDAEAAIEEKDDEEKDEAEPDAKAATIGQLKSIGLGADFALSCCEAGLSLAQATAVAATFKAAAEARDNAISEAAKLKAQVDRLANGIEPVVSTITVATQTTATLADEATAFYTKNQARLDREGFADSASFVAWAVKEEKSKW